MGFSLQKFNSLIQCIAHTSVDFHVSVFQGAAMLLTQTYTKYNI